MKKPAQFASYKNLIVHQKPSALTRDIIVYFLRQEIPQTIGFVGEKLCCSINLVGAKTAGGYGKHYKGNQKQFFSIARGFSFESDYWLEVLSKLSVFNVDKIYDLSQRNTRLSKSLTT